MCALKMMTYFYVIYGRILWGIPTCHILLTQMIFSLSVGANLLSPAQLKRLKKVSLILDLIWILKNASIFVLTVPCQIPHFRLKIHPFLLLKIFSGLAKQFKKIFYPSARLQYLKLLRLCQTGLNIIERTWFLCSQFFLDHSVLCLSRPFILLKKSDLC